MINFSNRPIITVHFNEYRVRGVHVNIMQIRVHIWPLHRVFCAVKLLMSTYLLWYLGKAKIELFSDFYSKPIFEKKTNKERNGVWGFHTQTKKKTFDTSDLRFSWRAHLTGKPVCLFVQIVVWLCRGSRSRGRAVKRIFTSKRNANVNNDNNKIIIITSNNTHMVINKLHCARTQCMTWHYVRTFTYVCV